MVLNQFLDNILGFMLNWPPLTAILVLSAGISLLIVLVYKFMTDQKEMKQLKTQLKEYQKKMKTLRDKPEKLMKVQKEAMSINGKYMKKSMKPTLITFIPILILFSWMNAHFAYEPLLPGDPFELTAVMEDGVTGNVSITTPEGITATRGATARITERAVTFQLQGEAGRHYVTLEHDGASVDKEILIDDRDYADVTKKYDSDVFDSATLGNKKLRVLWNLTWIWAYIIFAIVFSMLFRKIMKVY